MNTFKVSVQETSNNAIIKFEVNQFITQHQSFEFNNIDEAKDSPLAQQLFYLPFVKKVYISSNFIAIERYNIVKMSTCIKLVSEINLVNCNNQDIDKKIKRMNKHPLEISKKIYLSILFITKL